ncbi:hypothetical protein L873DRAFT_1815199 [Choiromyces venosus 120613-1]|uniref:Uncharacterized protein n=1 Tax=Choiromyces venosus 120613-1 TaxID=1336337 RepID=A0A3N4JA48_9PEZI|nr:hypothetical protein L873DRAFT_1815199 [Choiromyces venosus 120613-1]
MEVPVHKLPRPYHVREYPGWLFLLLSSTAFYIEQATCLSATSTSAEGIGTKLPWRRPMVRVTLHDYLHPEDV